MFTTESAAAWFSNPNTAAMSISSAPGVHVASTEGDFLQRAGRVAEKIRQESLPLVFFHCDFSDQIAARVAAFRVAPVQVNVAHHTPMMAGLFDGYVHLSRNGAQRFQLESCPVVWIPPSSDIEKRMQTAGF